MKTLRRLLVLSAGAVLLGPAIWAQDKPKAAEESRPVTALKLQVVLSELEGEKKVSNLPYIMFVNADDRDQRPTQLRMGLRVPVFVNVSTKEASSNFQYMDVGTNIDCSARPAEGGRFNLNLSVERSSLYTASPEKKPVDWSPGDVPLSSQPIIRQFRASFKLLMRDGETVQSALATDPVSGRVLKVEVTAWVAK